MVAQALISALRRHRQVDLCEFKASMVLHSEFQYSQEYNSETQFQKRKGKKENNNTKTLTKNFPPQDKVFLCNPDYPGTHFVDQASLKLTHCLPLSSKCWV